MRLRREIRHIQTRGGKMKIILLRPVTAEKVPGILWIHGGGYATGMPEMVYISEGRMLAARYGALILSPGYRLSWKAPYPAAAEDCYAALEYLYDHAEELGVDPKRIIVGGESAGGGLCAAVTMMARDRGIIPVAFHLPLYPMLDSEDTVSSRDNHGKVWNTRKNHKAWKMYLRDLYGKENVPKYASPSRESDYSGMPPCYTFVADGEPFYEETLAYVKNLNDAGVYARVDVYHGDRHAFDLIPGTPSTRKAKKNLCAAYEELMKQLPVDYNSSR